jgi:hypothetical protein
MEDIRYEQGMRKEIKAKRKYTRAKSTSSSQAAFYFHDFWRLANIFHQHVVAKTSFTASAVLSPIANQG